MILPDFNDDTHADLYANFYTELNYDPHTRTLISTPIPMMIPMLITITNFMLIHMTNSTLVLILYFMQMSILIVNLMPFPIPIPHADPLPDTNFNASPLGEIVRPDPLLQELQTTLLLADPAN